jgi:integrase
MKMNLDAMQAEMRGRHIVASTTETSEPTLPEICSTSDPELPYSRDWETFLADQVPGARPDAVAYVLRHKPSCKGTKKYGDKRCECPKWGYVNRERNRFSLFTNHWEIAEARIAQYRDRRDVAAVREQQRAAEWDAIHSYKRMKIADGVPLLINAKLTGKVAMMDEAGKIRDIATSKIRTYINHLQNFLKTYNAAHPNAAPVEYFDQITTALLQDHWRPTWTATTINSKNNQRTYVISVFHYAMEQHWMPDTRKMGLQGGCQCIACKLHPVDGVALTQPKLPFDMPSKKHRHPEWQTRHILAACKKLNSESRPHCGTRLAALIQVGLWSGARIVDAVLMAKSAVDLETGMWSFQPLKTRNRTGKTVTTQLPPHVCQLLRDLPAADSHPAYFFWTGDSTPQNGPDPWHRDLAMLWPLVDEQAQVHRYLVTKGKTREQDVWAWGMQDPAKGNRWSKVSFHSFRNTFAVRCRISGAGMSFTRIAELLGDSEAIVIKHYAPYTQGVEDAVTKDLRSTWPEQSKHEEIALRKAAYVVSSGDRAASA